MDSTPLTFTDLLNSETDLNEPTLTYDFPSSQYCSNESKDCTNEETHASNNKKAQRQGNFTIEEDKLLVSAWLNVGLDPVRGSEQKKKQFWSRIATYFQENKRWTGERTDKSLTNRWSTISASVNKFCGYYSQIENFRKSGYTEQDKIVEAKQMYKKEEGSVFGLDHCWVILRFQQKWMDECQKLNAKKKFKTTYQNGGPDSINLEDENEEGPEPAPLKRPIGRKAAKEVIKKAKSKEHGGDNEKVPSTISSELEDFRMKKLESERLRAQQFELLIASEHKQVTLREKEIELQQRSEDVKIMTMDTSALAPIRAEYIISLQKEILAKRAGSGFNQ